MSAVLQHPESTPVFDAMREADVDAVIAIEERIYEFPWTRGNFLDSIRAGYACWVLRDAQGLVGYAIVTIAAGEAHLLNLSIDARHQRQGHGARLLAHVIAGARARGASILFLEVRPSNVAGRHLYVACGFKRIGVRRDYYPATRGREDAWVLALDL